MNYFDLRDALHNFNAESTLKSRKPFYELRKDFVKRFPVNAISFLKIDDYIEGKRNIDSFCYGLERTLDCLGRMTGSTAIKFGVYYSQSKSQYCFSRKYGDDYKEAFTNIKVEIVDLLKAGKKFDTESIIGNPISPMFKGKILATYYPERYLNIFSNDHLNHFLKVLDIDNEKIIKSDPVLKRQALVDYKNGNKDMADWSLDIFQTFLYNYFHPDGCSSEYSALPTVNTFEYVDDLSIDEGNLDDIAGKNLYDSMSKKIDYDEENRKYREYGDFGEKVVVKAEISRLVEELGFSCEKAEKAVKRVSLQSDSYGYDILSVNEDGSKRYIEVKATVGKVGDISFYYTQNEYQKAIQYGENYYIYIVYDINCKPKIWRIQNPFISGSKLRMTPIKYKVDLQTRKIG